MKGKSIIELRDVHTGEVERHIDHNLVTNGLKVFPGTAIWGKTELTEDKYFPLWKNWFSGLKLFENTLEENPDNYIHKYSEPITGYASNTANTADPKRGLFNISESGILEGASGIRLVWDFAQSQANGQISCISIVPNIFVIPENINKMYYNQLTDCNIIGKLKDGTYIGNVGTSSSSNSYLIDYDRQKRLATIVTNIDLSAGTIKLVKCILEPLLYSSVSDRNLSIVEEHDVEIPFKTSYIQFYLTDGGKYYAILYQGNAKAGGLYNNEFILIAIDKQTYVVERTTFFTQTAENNDYVQIGISFENNGFLFVRTNYHRYKIEISNLNNIEELEHLATANLITNGELLGNGWVVDSNGNYQEKISGTDWRVKYYSNNSTSLVAFVELIKGIYMLFGMDYISSSSGSISKHETWYGISINVDTRILYTINNLATPVIKTADKTMKITYILTNE